MKILVVIVLLPTISWACPKGSVEYEGNCAVELQPAESSAADSAKWVSDEKPPKTTTGQWQTGNVQLVTLQSQSTVEDEIAAAKKWDAAHSQPPRAQ